MFVGWHPAGPVGLPATPEEGEAGWRAWQVDRHTAELLRPPTPVGEGRTGGRVGVRVQEGDPSRTKVSSRLNCLKYNFFVLTKQIILRHYDIKLT
jgi:hypothetical protein